MGISINVAIQMARLAPLLAGCENGIMLGRQKMHFRRKQWTSRLISALGERGITATEADLVQPDGFCETFLKNIGWPPLQSLDFSDIEGTEFIHDPSEPVGEDLRGRFNLIYGGGTTEHVFDIAQSYRNIDAMLTDGGIFISNVGADGWFGHGFYQVGPDIPWRYWGASLNYEVLGVWTFNRAGHEPPNEILDPTGRKRGAEQSFEKPQFINYAVRKTPRTEAPKPVIQSHYVDY